MQLVMQMHKYVMAVTIYFKKYIAWKQRGAGNSCPINSYAACVVDYSLANNQLAKHSSCCPCSYPCAFDNGTP